MRLFYYKIPNMNNFDKNWKNASKSIFRLEGLAEYRLAEEVELIEKWKRGEMNPNSNPYWQKWIKSLKSAKDKGITVQRVRVAKEPLPDYIKFEIDLWQKFSTKSGEEIYFIGVAEYQEIIASLGFNPKDFWLFDDNNLLIFNYDKAGKFSGEILIADGGMIKRYSGLKTKLLQKATPMASFVKNIKTE